MRATGIACAPSTWNCWMVKLGPLLVLGRVPKGDVDETGATGVDIWDSAPKLRLQVAAHTAVRTHLAAKGWLAHCLRACIGRPVTLLRAQASGS
jgi:hypothetical protein